MTDPFDDASSSFTNIEDIDGRHVVIRPTATGTAKGKTGEPYDFVTADVIVLDGAVTEKIDQVPGVIADMRFSAGSVVSSLKPKLRTGKPVYGLIHSQPSTFNPRVLAYVLKEPTDSAELRALAVAQTNQYLAKQDPFK